MKKIDVRFILPNGWKSGIDQKSVEFQQILKRYIVTYIGTILLLGPQWKTKKNKNHERK